MSHPLASIWGAGPGQILRHRGERRQSESEFRQPAAVETERQVNSRIQPDTKSQCDFFELKCLGWLFVQLILNVPRSLRLIMPQWESYEQVGTYLLDQFAAEFGLDRVEAKQEVPGQRSGTSWEIDAKGVRHGDDGFVIVEFRRYTTSRQKQEKMGALAHKIIDTGAKVGIIVSPLGLQEGAEKVSAAENVINVILNENCNRHEYIMRFLNRVMIDLQDTLSFKDTLQVEVRDKNSNIIRCERVK